MILIGKIKRFLNRKTLCGRVMARQMLLAWAFSLGAFLFALVFNVSMSYMGNKDDAAASFVLKNFWHMLLFIQLKILLTYVIFFMLLGFVGGLFIYCMLLLTNKQDKGRGYGWFAFLVPVALYVHIFGWQVLQYPQVFARTLFEKGGIRQSVQLFFTDVMGAGYFNIVFVLFLLLFGGAVLYLLWDRGHLFKWGNALTRFFRRPLFAAAALLFVAGLIFIPFPSEVSAKGKRYNLLILASDALRPDRLSINGYKRKTSPAIDALMCKGVSFSRTFIEVPRTFPSWVSLLCGQYSFEHGIRHMFPTKKARQKNFPSLASHLKKKRYGTAIVSDFAGDIFPRIKLGFDIVKAPYMNFDALLMQGSLEIHTFLFPFILNSVGRSVFPVLREFAQLPDGSVLASDAKSVISTLAKQGNFFVTVFFSTTHFPYANKYPYYKQFTDSTYDGFYKYYKNQVIMGGKSKKITKKDIKQVNDLYDGGVRAFDDGFASILSFLKKRGLDKNTIVVVLADHGENLYEPGMLMGHGEHLRGDYSTRVPFMIYHPGYPKKQMLTSEQIVRVIDVAPTLASLLGTGKHKEWRGDDCSYWVTGEGRKPPKRFAYSETGIWFTDRGDDFFQKQRVLYPGITRISQVDFKNNREITLLDRYDREISAVKHRSIRTDRYRLIYIPTREGVRYELYDMRIDVDCKNNIAQKKPAVVRRLKQKLFEMVRRGKKEQLLNQFILPMYK